MHGQRWWLRGPSISNVCERREGSDERTTDNAESHAQNERDGAGWHQRVKDFLERRKVWEAQPHPGRTYCR